MKPKNRYLIHYVKDIDLSEPTIWVAEIKAYTEKQARFLFDRRKKKMIYKILKVEVYTIC
jgi:hypothetical protein